MVLPFKWNLFGSSFARYHLLLSILQTKNLELFVISGISHNKEGNEIFVKLRH